MSGHAAVNDTINKFARVLSGAIHQTAVTRLVKITYPGWGHRVRRFTTAVGPHIVAAQRLLVAGGHYTRIPPSKPILYWAMFAINVATT
jgi:hypothetical protein